MNRLAEKIKKARIKAGITEKELAKKCGLSVGYIIQIESGKKIIKEAFADKILKSLGEKTERLEADVPKPKATEAKKTIKSKQQESVRNINPTGQWADALAGVIKTYSIVDCRTGSVVGHKDLPILSKKIEGVHADKIIFVKASDDTAKALRIYKGDVVTIAQTHEIQNGKIYLLEHEGKKIMRKLKKDGERMGLFSSELHQDPLWVNKKAVKIIGKCLKSEHQL